MKKSNGANQRAGAGKQGTKGTHRICVVWSLHPALSLGRGWGPRMRGQESGGLLKGLLLPGTPLNVRLLRTSQSGKV